MAEDCALTHTGEDHPSSTHAGVESHLTLLLRQRFLICPGKERGLAICYVPLRLIGLTGWIQVWRINLQMRDEY